MTWHVNDLKVSQADKDVVDAFIELTKETYEDVKKLIHQESRSTTIYL